MSESNLYKQFKNHWQPRYVNRIETALLGNGFPDCHLVNDNKRDVFVELKFIKKAFKNKILPIRISQIHWMLKYKGCHAYFLFKIDKTFFLFDKSKAIVLKDKIKWEDFVCHSLMETTKIINVINFLNDQK